MLWILFQNSVASCIVILNMFYLLILYFHYTLVFPHLSYCNLIWADLNITNLHLIHLKQKRIMRLCSNSHWLEHTPPLFKRFRSLTIYDIHKFNLGLFMYNYTCNNLPDSFKDYFTQNRNIHNHPTRISSLYRLYNFKYNLARNTIRRQGPLIWNQINLKFRNTKSVYLRRNISCIYYLITSNMYHLI